LRMRPLYFDNMFIGWVLLEHGSNTYKYSFLDTSDVRFSRRDLQ